MNMEPWRDMFSARAMREYLRIAFTALVIALGWGAIVGSFLGALMTVLWLFGFELR